MSLQIQKPAPDFEAEAVMPDGSFKTVKLSDYKGKYIVLFFYPLDFTFVYVSAPHAHTHIYICRSEPLRRWMTLYAMEREGGRGKDCVP